MRKKNESGQALVLVAVSLVALIGVMGLAIDMGVLRYQKRLQQTAADAAAIAGATNLINTSDGPGSAGVVSGGMAASAANGFADTSSTCTSGCASSGSVGYVTVTINNPPASGPHTGDSNYVEALVSDVQPTFFARIFGVQSVPVIARAVATAKSGYQFGPNCMWTLNPPTASIEGVNVNGSPTLNAPSCGILDNGNFNTKGNALTITAGTFGSSGDWVSNGPGGTVTCTSGQTPCPQTNLTGITDPLAGLLTAPTPSLAPSTISISGGGNASCGTGCTYSSVDSTYYISQGTYCSITINGVASDKVVFNPGVYVIEGTSGGCSSQSLNIPGNATISGNGVMFYFTGSSTLNITGTPTMNLTAPAAGSTYPGLLFWQDPNDTNTNGPQLGGNNGSQFNGIVYFPNDQLTYFGNATSGGSNVCGDPNVGFDVGMVISGSVALSGNPCVNILGDKGLPGGVTGGVIPKLVE